MLNPPAIDPTLFAAAIVTVLAALFGGVIQLVNAVSASRDRRDAREERQALRKQSDGVMAVSQKTADKADTIIEKATEIHTLTNSANAKLQAQVEMMAEKLAASERTIARMEATVRDTLAAQSKSSAAIDVALHTTVPVDRRADDKSTLAQIETNTAATVDAVEALTGKDHP